MNSCLYSCKVRHERRRPKQHKFAYRCLSFCIDLDEIEMLDAKLSFFSYNKRNAYALRNSDHYDEGATSIKDNILRFAASQGLSSEVSKILLVTNLRTFGYVFNPVSFYYLQDAKGKTVAAVAEVANTFNEQKLYFLPNHRASNNRIQKTHDKHFYISPFSRLDTKMEFSLACPNERLSLSINERDEQGRFFFSSLNGTRKPLNNRALIWATLRFPFSTLFTIGAIHWQAALLAFKGVPYFRKKDREDLQKDTRTYLQSKHDAQQPTI